MIGIAAGLSTTGKIPFCTTFTPFATRRAYDQITISVAYAKRNVKIVGTDPGITATTNGGTHMCFQDLGIMRIMPQMTVLSPADAYELKAMVNSWPSSGPGLYAINSRCSAEDLRSGISIRPGEGGHYFRRERRDPRFHRFYYSVRPPGGGNS